MVVFKAQAGADEQTVTHTYYFHLVLWTIGDVILPEQQQVAH